MLKTAPGVEAPTRALLGAIDEAAGDHAAARVVVAPICSTANRSLRELIGKLCK